MAFIEKALQYEASEQEGLDYLRATYAKYLPAALTEPDSAA